MLLPNDLLNFLGRSAFEQFLGLLILAALIYLAYHWVFQPIYITLAGMWDFWKLRQWPMAILAITPPKNPEKSPLATQQLFTVLRQLLGKHEVMSLEIDATRKEGIRYLIQISPTDIPALQRQVVAYLPEVTFETIEAAPPTPNKHTRVLEIKQANHYAYPLLPNEDLAASDPIAYIAGAMTKLEPQEKITMQMVLAPHYSRWTGRLINQIMNKDHANIGIAEKVRDFVLSRWLIWLVAAMPAAMTNMPLNNLGIWVLIAQAKHT